MKSFGVRLAAGAGTILVVAYAIALAQKDNQAVSDTWNAESAVAPDPAVPIGTNESPAWLNQPDTQLVDQQQALSFNPMTNPVDSASGVEQVNYDETTVAAPVVAVAGFDSLPSDPTSVPQPTVLATPQVPLPGDSVLSSDVPGTADGTFSNEPSANLALPEADSLGLASPTFQTPTSSDHALAASSPEPSTGFGSSLPEITAVAADTTAAAMAAGGMAAGGIADLPASTASTFAAAAGVAAVATAGVAEANPAAAGLGFPTNSDSRDNSTGLGAPQESVAPAQLGAVPQPAGFSAQYNDQSNPQELAASFPAPANTLRGAAPAQNQLRSSAAVEPFASEAAATSPLAQSASLAEQPGIQTPSGFANGAQAYADDTMASGVVGSAIAASGASVMVDTAMAGDVAAAPATFRNGPPTPLTDGYGTQTGTTTNPVNMVPPNTAIALNPNATTDAPGERRLEGAQTPSVIIQKRAPAEVKVGKPAAFVISVRNVGAVEALDVEVHDRIPAGMRLADASPPPVIQGNLLMWQIGSMPAGDERTITLQLIPEQEGELGSVARVSFEAAASVRTIATRPMLKIEQQTPEKVLIGQQLEIALTISNTGSGKATNVEIWEDVPAGLSHPEGPQLKQNIGTLMPGEVRNDSLFLKAEQPGIIENTIRLVGDDGLTTEETVSVEVIAPQLEVALEGPTRRFLERQANYQLNVANAGTASATNVEISVQLSRGFTFVSTDFEGQYDPDRHAVFWSLAQLPAGAKGMVPLTLLPVETGEQVIKINANADLSALAQTERKMTVEGFADLDFSMTNPNGPIEIGAETTYDIVVHNSGSKADTNIRVQVQLPAGLELLSVDGDAGTDGNGLVAFQPKAQLGPGQEFKYRVRVRGTTAGTHIAKAVVVSDQSSVPVTKEDTTRVYADQ